MDVLFGLRGAGALVVGGGSGIGRATALMLARVGAGVVVADLDASRAEAVAAEVAELGVPSHALSGDVTDETEAVRIVDAAHAALGGLVAAVNIVGVASWSSLLDMSSEMWRHDIDANLTHHLYVGRAAARHWIADGVAGRLAIVTSISGIFGAPNHAAYGVFLTRCRLRSDAPSVHQTGPRSPSATFASFTRRRARRRRSSSSDRFAAATSRRARISFRTCRSRSPAARFGLEHRQSLPFTTK